MSSLAAERFWVDKACFHNAERQYYEYLSKKELAETETSSQNFYEDKLDNAKDQRTKPYKKPKKLKSKKDDCGPKDTSTTSESDEKILPFARPQLCSPVEVVEVVKLNTERNKKRNKSNKITETLFNNSQFFAEPKTNGADFVSTKCGVSVTKLKKTFSDAKIKGTATNNQCTLVSEIAKAREHIKNSLEKMDGIATLAASPVTAVVLDRIVAIEKDNADLRNLLENLQTLHLESQHRITELEKHLKSAVQSKNSVAVAIKKNKHADDDEVDLFGSESEEESEEAARVREERLASYAAKKSKKPTIIAKSNLILDVKPWDDQTDLGFMESSIRKIKSDGLIWGASKIIPVAYGIEKLSISCVVEDEKVSIDWLTEEIEKFEDYVQSVDIVAFNKI